MLLNKAGLNMQDEITEADFFHCPNCGGFEFFNFVPDGSYKEEPPLELLVCGDCWRIFDRAGKRQWLEATGDPDSAGCPVCGL